MKHESSDIIESQQIKSLLLLLGVHFLSRLQAGCWKVGSLERYAGKSGCKMVIRNQPP